VRLLAEAIALEVPSLVAIRRDLHAHPGLAFEETHASEVVRRELSRAGIPFAAGIAGTGVVAWILPETPAPHDGIAFRADLDALPIAEEGDLSYASRVPGRMHACGHDGHTTILLGAARVLARLRSRLPRPVKLIFQPAEETGAGAERMIEAGALDERTGGVRIARAFGVHGWPALPLGVVATRPGPLMAATDRFRIVVRGRGGHGSSPEATADPIVAAAHIVAALQTVVSRNVSPLATAVLSVGSFRAGEAPNVIPEEAILEGTIRTHDDGTSALVVRRLEEVAEGTARALGTGAQVEVTRTVPATTNDEEATRFLQEALATGSAGGLQEVRVLESPVMASEDFSVYGRHVPACFFFLGLRAPGKPPPPGLHTPRFDFNDAAIAPGVEAFCRLALRAE
jgi:amidohydrolase